MELLDEQTLKELEAIPEITVEYLRLEAFAYKVGVFVLKNEYPIMVEDDPNS